jgi:hypothetical protein
MICKILDFFLPTYTEYCISASPEQELVCQDWSIDEFGEATNCILPLMSGLPWDVEKLGRLVSGEESGYSTRKISALVPEKEYQVRITLKALMTESIPPFTELYHLTVNLGGNVIKIYNNDQEYITEDFTIVTDDAGEIELTIKTTSSNYQLHSINGYCENIP